MEPPIRTGRLAKVNDGTAGAPEGGVTFRARPSGIFSYTIATEGNVEVDGSTLRVVPTEGTESLTDPDSPSDSYTDQRTDLEPEEYAWSMSGSSLVLDGEFGVVELRPST